MSVTYVASLYVEGGPFDGETFVCGPFDTEQEAVAATSDLQLHGTADALPLYATVEDVEMAIS